MFDYRSRHGQAQEPGAENHVLALIVHACRGRAAERHG
jgi:hypothetical protein